MMNGFEMPLTGRGAVRGREATVTGREIGLQFGLLFVESGAEDRIPAVRWMAIPLV
jgi:hypothetical protein